MEILISGPNNDVKRYPVKSQLVRIGRSADNDLRLGSPIVPREAAVLELLDNQWEVEALAWGGLQVGATHLRRRQRERIENGVEIKVAPYTLIVELAVEQELSADAILRTLDAEMSEAIQAVHSELLCKLEERKAAKMKRRVEEMDLLELEQLIDLVVEHLGFLNDTNERLINHIAGHCVRSELIAGLSYADALASRSNAGWERHRTISPLGERQLSHALDNIKTVLGVVQEADESVTSEEIDNGYWQQWLELMPEIQRQSREYLAKRFLKKEIKDIMFGYGPLEDLLRTPSISEIMVVDKDHIYVEKRGVIENSGRRFVSNDVTEAIIDRIVSSVGKTINRASPLVDARLRDGSRVNAVIEPIAIRGPCLTIRRFSAQKLTVEDLVRWNSLTETAADFLEASVINRRNIIVSGGTGTGKTTLLNCLSDFIPDNERIVTVEDTVELRLSKEHVVQLEKKEKNIEGAGEYTIRALVRNALRMRPDRVVVGECRGAEALDMLQAMNTGHDGSLTTIHANSTRDVILRLEVLVQMAGEKLPIESIHRQVGSAVDVVVQLRRMSDGRRCVSEISEVVGVDEIRGGVQIRDLFVLDDEGRPDARLVATGHLPSFIGELIENQLIDLSNFYR